MPIKRVVGRGKRPMIASSSERRSKRRNDAPPPREPSPPLEPPPASISCVNRPVTTGRKVSFEFLTQEGFTIGEKIRGLGWEYFCSLELPTYPGLMREFFSSVARTGGGLTGSVKGVDVRITEGTLARVLRLPREGPAPSAHSQREVALNLILGRDDCSPVEEVYANALPVEMRLLLSIVNRVLFPKTGRFDFISERDLVVMTAIIEETPLNLPRMMLASLCEAASRPRLCLPYGMAFTLLFREFGVPIAEGEPKRLLRFTDFYNIGSLHRMGFQKVEGRWVRRPGPQVDQAGPSHPPGSPPHIHPTDMPHTSSPPLSTPIPPASSSTSQTLLLSDEQLDSIVSRIATRVSTSLSERIDALSGEVHSLSERISVLESSRHQDGGPRTDDLRELRDDIATQIEELRDEIITSVSADHSYIIQSLEEILDRISPD